MVITIGSSYEWQAKYDRHIRSLKWRNMKQDMLRLRGGRCERCGHQHSLELHHKNYERLGRELIADLELLCKRCHETADRERALQGQMRSAAAQYNAALDTYASKKYGEDWDCRHDSERIAEEFDQWLERKEDLQ
jgi:HNH endonuclease